MYPAYGYATPPPALPQPARSGNPLALILLGIVALAGIAVGALAATGVFSHNATTQTITSTAHARATTKHQAPAGTTTHPNVNPPSQTQGGGAAPGGATTSCGGDLAVGPNTSCGFAQNVEQAYDQTTGGEQAITAYSPATGTNYTIDCTGGSPHVCTGGTTHNASIYFTSGPSGSPSTTPPSTTTPIPNPGSTAGLHACDQNISANAATSCPFAENVFKAYAQDYQTNGPQSNDVVTAYSPVTNQSYSMDCTTDGVTVNCAGTTNNFVTFPMHAVQVY